MTLDPFREQEMIARSRRRSVPQIFIDEQSVGGYDDLKQLNTTGESLTRSGSETLLTGY